MNLLVWLEPGLTLGSSIGPVSAMASTVGFTVSAALSELGSTLRGVATSVVLIPTGPIVVPVPLLPLWWLQSITPVVRELSVAERTARVSSVKVAPHKFVGYIGDSVTFVAMGADFSGQPAHGAKFTWESSDPSKLTIDEAGRATLLQPGLVTVTARAELAAGTAPVLIRSARRRLQTDNEWRADQDSLVASAEGQSGTEGALASLMDRLGATAYAQGNSPGDYGNAAYVGQVGTPPFTALKTRDSDR